MNEDKRPHDDTTPEPDERWGGTDDNKPGEAAGDTDSSREEPASGSTPESAPAAPEPAAAPVRNEPAGSDEEETGAQGVMTLVIILVVVALAAAAWFLFFSGNGSVQNLMPGGNGSAGDDDNAAAVTRSYPEVVAIVNGEEVSRAELIEAVANLGRQAQGQGLDMGDPQTQQLVEDQALTTLLNTTLLLQAAEAEGVSVGDEEIDAEIAQLKTQLGGEEAFAAQLEAMGLSESDVREDVAEQLLISEYLETVEELDDVTVTDEEVQAFYDEVSAGGQELPPLEDVRPQIEQQLSSQAEQAVLSELIAKLRADAEIEVLINTGEGAEAAE